MFEKFEGWCKKGRRKRMRMMYLSSRQVGGTFRKVGPKEGAMI